MNYNYIYLFNNECAHSFKECRCSLWAHAWYACVQTIFTDLRVLEREKVISFPQYEVGLSKFLPLWRCFSGNELCLHQTLGVRLPCPDIFKGKSITFLFQWIKLIKKPSLYSGASERELFFGSEWKQRQRWKGSFLERNKKACTKECINVETRGERCVVLGLRVEKKEGPTVFLYKY